jgi:hypothetical protein
MKTVSFRLLGCACFAFIMHSTSATCLTTGNPSQSARILAGNIEIESWEVNSNIHRTKLANGFELGIKIEPAPADFYDALRKKVNGKELGEFSKISVYEMHDSEPKLLTFTWAGVNSKQGYGPNGGANRVNAIGEPGIELQLQKEICNKSSKLTTVK